MVLILSIATDLSTVHVLEWLDAWQIPWVRISPDDLIRLVKFHIASNGSMEFELLLEDGRSILSSEITSYWYRRGDITLKYTNRNEARAGTPKELQSHLNREVDTLMNALHSAMRGVRHLNGRMDNETNKLNNLITATRHGLRVPRTLITSSPRELREFQRTCTRIVTKGLHSGFFFSEDGIDYEGFTRRVTTEEVRDLACDFHPTLFQEEIPKRYEIRSFFLSGAFYSMAIFSQGNAQTEVDFRNYDQNKPNRTVPYRLPAEMEQQITGLMAELGLQSGSLDLIRGEDGSFIFLEINPIGQFGQVSIPCNYALEMQVAKYLSHGAQKHEEVPRRTREQPAVTCEDERVDRWSESSAERETHRNK